MVLGGGLWLLDSMVPVGDYDEAVDELGATEEALVRTRTMLREEQATTAALEQQLDAIEKALARSRTDLLEEEARAEAIEQYAADLQAALNLPTQRIESAAELRSRFVAARPAALLLGYFAGVDPQIVNQHEYESWAGVVKLDMAVEAVDDPELTELYWEHLGECTGFAPECEDLLLRLIELTVEPILEDQ